MSKRNPTVTERVEYTEKVVKVDIDKVFQHLTDAGVATNEMRILAPIIFNAVMGYIDLLKDQHQSSAALQQDSLKLYERSKNNGYMLRRRTSGCGFDADSAMQHSLEDALHERTMILRAKYQLDTAQLKMLEGFATAMVQQVHQLMGSQQASGAEVLQKIIKDSTVIDGTAERVEEEE